MSEQKENIITGFASGHSNENHISLLWLNLQHAKQRKRMTGCTWSNLAAYNFLVLKVNTSHANFSLITQKNTYIHLSKLLYFIYILYSSWVKKKGENVKENVLKQQHRHFLSERWFNCDNRGSIRPLNLSADSFMKENIEHIQQGANLLALSPGNVGV